MADSSTILDRIGEEQGWNDASKLGLCLQYIDAQESDDAWEDFLRQAANFQNDKHRVEALNEVLMREANLAGMTPLDVVAREVHVNGQNFSQMFGCSECEHTARDVLAYLIFHGNRWDTQWPSFSKVTREDTFHCHGLGEPCEFDKEYLDGNRVNAEFVRKVTRTEKRAVTPVTSGTVPELSPGPEVNEVRFEDGSRIYRIQLPAGRWVASWEDGTPLRGDNDERSFFDTAQEALNALQAGDAGSGSYVTR